MKQALILSFLAASMISPISEASGKYNKSEDLSYFSYCEITSRTAVQIKITKQDGVSKADSMKMFIDEGDQKVINMLGKNLIVSLIDDAYSSPRLTTKSAMYSEAHEFGVKAFQECVGALRNNNPPALQNRYR